MDKVEKVQRSFKGVWIPEEIYLNENLSPLDKFIFTEINSLDGEEGCFASNEYLAKFCQCSVCKVSASISKLIKMKYIYQESFNGRIRILKSNLKYIGDFSEINTKQTTTF